MNRLSQISARTSRSACFGSLSRCLEPRTPGLQGLRRTFLACNYNAGNPVLGRPVTVRHLTVEATVPIDGSASEVDSGIVRRMPTTCPGCGAYSQVVDPSLPGFFDPTKRIRTVRDIRASKAEEDAIFQSVLRSGIVNRARKENEEEEKDHANEEGEEHEEEGAEASTVPWGFAPSPPKMPICDRCHNLLYQSKGNSILHPSMESIRDIIEESPHTKNHIYHILDAADFPMSLIPNLQKKLDLSPLRSQNRRSKRARYAHGQRVAEVTFIITRSDLLAPKKEQVDRMVPMLREVLREALGKDGRSLRLGNVRCVSAKRGWWTTDVKQEIYRRGGAGWMVGKVNVGKSALYEVVFPKGRDQERDVEIRRMQREERKRIRKASEEEERRLLDFPEFATAPTLSEEEATQASTDRGVFGSEEAAEITITPNSSEERTTASSTDHGLSESEQSCVPGDLDFDHGSPTDASPVKVNGSEDQIEADELKREFKGIVTATSELPIDARPGAPSCAEVPEDLHGHSTLQSSVTSNEPIHDDLGSIDVAEPTGDANGRPPEELQSNLDIHAKNQPKESLELQGSSGMELKDEPPLDEDGDDDGDITLLPPAQEETAYPHMPTVSSLPGTTASPIRIPFGRGKGELIDLPGIERSSLADYVQPEHHRHLIMKSRIRAEQYTIKPGQSLLLGGLIRITPKAEDELIFLAYPFVPISPHVTATPKAIGLQTGFQPDGEAFTSGVSTIITTDAQSSMRSAGTFQLSWDVTKARTGALTDRTAGKRKVRDLPFTVYSADVLIEGVGWVELVCQVRNWRKRASSDPVKEGLGLKDEDVFGETREDSPPEVAYPAVEVWSPLGKFVGIRRPLNTWVVGGTKKTAKHKQRPRPRQTISLQRRKEGGARGGPKEE